MTEDTAAPASEAPPRKTGVAGAATLVGILTAASLVLGFGRDIVIAAVFGASAELDAYFVAQGLMNLVLGLAAGATAKAVVPVVAPAAQLAMPRVHIAAWHRRWWWPPWCSESPPW